ncbi:MAG: hypothetical protein ACJ0Q3_07275 [Candidatus Azotimanducaceae bacterium]
MSKIRKKINWALVILLGLVNGILEDLLFISVLVPNMPASLDLTGDLFWIFTVPLAQIMALTLSGTAAWFLGIKHLPQLITFWACWVLARTTFLSLVNNPIEDIAIYLVWITFWCVLIGLAGFLKRSKAS